MTICACLLVAAASAAAQPLSFGVAAGISLTPLWNTSARPFTVGPSVEVAFPRGLAFHADLLYKGLDFGPGDHSGRWELPVVMKYSFGMPFVEAGVSYNRVSGNPSGAELRHRGTHGAVIGAGIDRRIGRFRLRPEFRLTHWFDRNFGVRDAPIRSSLTQAEVLLGFLF